MAENKKTKPKEKEEKVKAEKAEFLGYVVLSDGTKKKVLSEEGKYYVCKDSRFRKSSSVFVLNEKKEVTRKNA